MSHYLWRARSTSRYAFYHLRLIGQLVPYLASWDLATVFLWMVIFMLDYCNSFYIELLLNLMWKLQLAQNAAAHLLTMCFCRHTFSKYGINCTSCLLSSRSISRLLCLPFKPFRTMEQHVFGTTSLHIYPVGSCTLQSTSPGGPKNIWLASTRAKAFLTVNPTWWNELPIEIRALEDILQFHKACKTELFNQDFSWDRGNLFQFGPPMLTAPGSAAVLWFLGFFSSGNHLWGTEILAIFKK